MGSNANTRASDAKLSLCHLHHQFNVFRQIPRIVSDLMKSNYLLEMLIGMLNQVKNWIFHLIKTHERLDIFNAIWYPYLHITTSFQIISHMRRSLNGMERR